jgi:hypothetical protein
MSASALDADIFVVGTAIDPHVTAVLNLVSDDLAVCRFNVDEFPASNRITVATGSSNSSVFVDNSDGSWNVSGCSVAWFRRLGRPGISAELSEAHQRFAGGEAEEALSGALSLIGAKVWLNEYWATRRAATKLLQYEAARLAGLVTPDTLVSSDQNRVRQFLKGGRADEFVYKTLHSPVIDYRDRCARGFVFTNRVEDADMERLNLVRYAPAQFQRCVDVAYELRVTSVGKQHFGIRIDGASRESKVRDWRAEGDWLHHSRCDLPSHIEDRLTRLMNYLKIEFGASDWIITPSGDYVFLEVNPHGAWLWLEEKVSGLPISAAVADFLEAAC